jgi:hypothetical protein
MQPFSGGKAMGSPRRKNYSRNFQHVKDQFQNPKCRSITVRKTASRSGMQQRDFHQSPVLYDLSYSIVVRGLPQLERFSGRLSCGVGDFENLAVLQRIAKTDQHDACRKICRVENNALLSTWC